MNKKTMYDMINIQLLDDQLETINGRVKHIIDNILPFKDLDKDSSIIIYRERFIGLLLDEYLATGKIDPILAIRDRLEAGEKWEEILPLSVKCT